MLQQIDESMGDVVSDMVSHHALNSHAGEGRRGSRERQ